MDRWRTDIISNDCKKYMADNTMNVDDDNNDHLFSACSTTTVGGDDTIDDMVLANSLQSTLFAAPVTTPATPAAVTGNTTMMLGGIHTAPG